MSPRWTRAIEEGKHGVAALPGRPAMSGDAHRAEWHTLPPTLASVLVAALMFMMTTLLHFHFPCCKVLPALLGVRTAR